MKQSSRRRVRLSVAVFLMLACGAVHRLVANGSPYQYSGEIHFDISKTPFSRYGSYMAFSPARSTENLPEGLYLHDFRGAVSPNEVFRVELLLGGNPIPYKIMTTPELLRLEAPEGYVEICFAEPKIILIRGAGVGLRLTEPRPEIDVAFPHSKSQWEVSTVSHHVKFLFTARRGNLEVDAPWDGRPAEHLAADFVPDTATGKFEGMLEEFMSVESASLYEKSFDDALRGVTSEYHHWLQEMPTVSEQFGSTAELAAYVDWESVVNSEGHFTRPAMLMSKNWMTKVWSWDQCFNAMALIHGNPKLAWDQFMLPIDSQDPQGAFPDSINDQAFVWSFTKPPIQGWALAWMMKHSQFIGREQLAQVYEPLSRWTNWYFRYRDTDHDGLPEYDDGNDSGWDNSTIFQVRPPIEAPDLSAYLVVQMDVLSDIARTLGKPEEAETWKHRADDLLTKLLTRMWKEDRFVAMQSGDHVLSPSQSLILYLPLVLGNRLPKAVVTQLVADLKENGRFLTENGLATEGLRSPKYVPDGYWRGPIWASSTMIIIEALDAAGEKQFANDLRIRFCRMVAKSGMSENFDAITGEGLRDPAYTWTSSVFMILAHESLGAER